MTMHLEGPWLSTTGKKKGKRKFASAEHARKARERQESWAEFMKKWDIKPTEKKKVRPSQQGLVKQKGWAPPPGRETPHYPSLNSDSGVAAKKPVQQYTGDAMIGIGQLHKSNSIPVFSKEDAVDISKMRRG